jgi:hypothetical protein
VAFLSRMRCASLWCVIAGAVLGWGCGQEPTRPTVTDVGLTVTAKPDSGGPSMPISMLVLVANVGNTRVLHGSGCCGDGFGVRVLGPDGNDVALYDPRAPWPACPCGPPDDPLEPGMTLEGGGRFTGVLYQRDSPTYPSPTYAAPSGTYTVIGSFAYQGPSGEWVQLARSTTFVWGP